MTDKNEKIERLMKNLEIKNKENKYRIKKLTRALEMLSVGIYTDVKYYDNLLVFKNHKNHNATCINIEGLYFNRDVLN
jgi:hypothetical protein|tara:strand:+ start:860 stop:1093 length:234 start_codon:yes stop_codon:yes gene_type:complete